MGLRLTCQPAIDERTKYRRLVAHQRGQQDIPHILALRRNLIFLLLRLLADHIALAIMRPFHL